MAGSGSLSDLNLLSRICVLGQVLTLPLEIDGVWSGLERLSLSQVLFKVPSITHKSSQN